jgi:hypothetical protein
MQFVRKTDKQILNAKATNVALNMAKASGDQKYKKYESALTKAKALRDDILAKYKMKAMMQVRSGK